MNEIKNEMKRRYYYLYENASFLYSCFMREETEEEKNKYKKMLSQTRSVYDYRALDLNLLDSETLYLMETIMVGDGKLEETDGYMYLEKLKKDPTSKLKSTRGLILKEKYNQTDRVFPLYFDLYELLEDVYENIHRQSDEYENRSNKLMVIDEYIRIFKKENSYKVWHGGYHLDGSDYIAHDFVPTRYSHFEVDLSPSRPNWDTGVKENDFITKAKDIRFTEKEKQEIFLKYNDVIPHDLYHTCDAHGLEIERSHYTKPCQRDFSLLKSNMFVVKNNDSYVFFTKCEYCGYLIGIPKNLIPLSKQKEVIENCQQDPLLIEKVKLESALRGLRLKKQAT